MDDVIQKLKQLYKSKSFLLLCCVCVGSVILLIGGNQKPAQQTTVADADVDEAEYVEHLESRIHDIVCQIRGAGDNKVMVYAETTTESVYVKESRKSYDSGDKSNKSETEDSVLTMTDSSGNEYALVTKRIMPKVSGVTVVCAGGADPSVRNAVISAVSTVLNIGANKVCVIAKAN